MAQKRAIIIGAGIGGLAASLDLANAGWHVTVLERQAAPGGKMRRVQAGTASIDAGPTVFTMRWVFEQLFAAAGTTLDAELTLNRADILARHAWSAGETLDLHADLDQSTDAIAAFAGPGEAASFRDFSARARQIYETLETPFLRGALPTPLSLVRQAGIRRMLAISPFHTMMRALAAHFTDKRLRQLFGRYATYCGSSPYLAPATLMLVAHVERDGVWLVDGGMHNLASALARVAARNNVVFRYNAPVASIDVEAGRATAVRLVDGERIEADAIIVNADAAALAAGHFGQAVTRAVPALPPQHRSLSAVTWAMQAQTDGFPLTRHNVFFSRDYAAEFADLFDRRQLPREPTVYVCAQDRSEHASAPDGPERLLCLVNAPANGDTAAGLSETEITQCETACFQLLARCGLHVDRIAAASVRTTPQDFATLFPATGGALYGRAVHGPMATFQRPGSRTAIPGLYLAGGSTHPGAGVPMAALSGRLAAADVIATGVSTSRSSRAATNGGTSTRSATTAPTA